MGRLNDSGMQSPEHMSFGDRENRCLRIFQWVLGHCEGIWHLCTPGEGQPTIFSEKGDYAYMMTLIALCSYELGSVKIITFEVMGNHLHVHMSGSHDDVLAFHDMLVRRLRAHFSKQGRPVDLSRFGCPTVIPVNSLESLRNQIVYINRNNFVVDPDQTPFSYPYGANSYYFSPAAKRCSDGTFGGMLIHDRRKLVHSRNIDYPDSWIMYDGYVSPVSYVRLDIGEGVFRDARHYFHKISRDIESYREIADQLGDSVYYTDDELNTVIYRTCRQSYNCNAPSLLPSSAKLELAKTLHYDYNADNKKIARLLKLEKGLVDELFPLQR